MSAIFGIVQTFFYPAYTALIPELVAPEMLPSANSLQSISIGAFIIALGGTSLAFTLDGVSFFISALCLVAIPRVPALRQAVEKEYGLCSILHGCGSRS